MKELVSLLRKTWRVWWDEDITQGNWDETVQKALQNTKAVIPVFSRYSIKKNVFVDEVHLAQKNGCLIFPFFIDDVDPLLGFGRLHRTNAFGWDGDENHPGYQLLRKKIATELELKRATVLKLQNKILKLPCFIFSLSSFETQLHPQDGLKLFKYYNPAALLISSYDVKNNDNRDFLHLVNEVRESSTVLFLDSGNYEADHKNDRFSEINKNGWRNEYYIDTVKKILPDIAFAFDDTNPEGDLDQVAEKIIKCFQKDEKSIQIRDSLLCPIVHLPKKADGMYDVESAPELIVKVTASLDPIMVAIPERELGNGIISRFKTIQNIRRRLNELGNYYPLHLLGAGNPLSIMAFAVAGADSFDGLEWCRTVADYDKGYLFHFSHFDCFKDQYLSRLRSSEIRKIISDSKASYTVQVISYNFDFFNDWLKTIQDLILTGQEEYLLKNIPYIGNSLLKELEK